MSAAVASSSSCPVSGRTSSSSCPFSSPAVSRRVHKRTSSRAPTDLPDLRRTPSSELLYLPPLLSLLPTQSRVADPTPFNFDRPAVGFTTSRLPQIDEASIALHHTLKHLRPTTVNYAYGAYEEAFNWEELVLPAEVEREWYIVAFRSTRAPGSPSTDLYEADRLAHEEAVSAGGLLAYWFGVPNSQGSNLATCIWMSRREAVLASSGEAHVRAMKLAAGMYSNYVLERYVLRKARGETGVSVEQWIGGEAQGPKSEECDVL